MDNISIEILNYVLEDESGSNLVGLVNLLGTWMSFITKRKEKNKEYNKKWKQIVSTSKSNDVF